VNSAALTGTIPKAVAKGGMQIWGDAANADLRIPNVRQGRILEILAMIESDCTCTMSDLARKFNLSESHLQHLFKQETGIGLGHVLTEKRLQTAAALLAQTSLRIKEIAAVVGYGHTSSFTRAFEQRFAQAPQAYRRGKGACN
jgi:transcriptional regulator GlxA family with amidase domain